MIITLVVFKSPKPKIFQQLVIRWRKTAASNIWETEPTNVSSDAQSSCFCLVSSLLGFMSFWRLNQCRVFNDRHSEKRTDRRKSGDWCFSLFCLVSLSIQSISPHLSVPLRLIAQVISSLCRGPAAWFQTVHNICNSITALNCKNRQPMKGLQKWAWKWWVILQSINL